MVPSVVPFVVPPVVPFVVPPVVPFVVPPVVPFVVPPVKATIHRGIHLSRGKERASFDGLYLQV
jgi:hypothetical protein